VACRPISQWPWNVTDAKKYPIYGGEKINEWGTKLHIVEYFSVQFKACKEQKVLNPEPPY
jgi:hypothetical protein